MKLTFITPEHPLYPAELDLRFRVLRQPLGMTREQVTFPFEAQSLHLVAHTEEVLGCVVFHPATPTDGRLFQMAVDPSRQKSGLGRQLVQALEARVFGDGFTRIHLHARVTAAGFYARLGYRAVGPEYPEVGVPHVTMDKQTSARR